MSFVTGDSVFPHHPDDPAPIGDFCVNNRPGDSWYLVVDDDSQDISWLVLKQGTQESSWHIYDSVIEFVDQFLIVGPVRSEFSPTNNLKSSYTVLPAVFNVGTVKNTVNDLVKLREHTGITVAYNIKNKVVSNFTLRQEITSSFKIRRVVRRSL